MSSVAYIFFIYKVNGPIQALVREGKRYFLSRLYSIVLKDRQIRCYQMHEEKVRLFRKSKETEINSSLKHLIDAREYNKDDRGIIRLTEWY